MDSGGKTNYPTAYHDLSINIKQYVPCNDTIYTCQALLWRVARPIRKTQAIHLGWNRVRPHNCARPFTPSARVSAIDPMINVRMELGTGTFPLKCG